MRIRPTGVTVALLILLAAFPLASQKIETKDQVPAPVAVFKSGVELVLVPVVVTDKSGNHVSGLKKEDFTVKENGNEQKVVFFEEVSTGTERLTRTKPEANTFSNMLSGPTEEHRVTIFLLDLLNTPYLDQTRAREALVKSLSDSFDPREPCALYVLTRSGLKTIHDFSTDPRVLIAAIKKVKGSTDANADTDLDPGNLPEVSGEAEELQEAMADAAENFNSVIRRIAAETTLQAMQHLAEAYAGLPGRKSVIWATGGFPFSISDASMGLAPAGRESLVDIAPLYERTWKAINDANFAIYPVDVRGLIPSAAYDASTRTQQMTGPRNPRGNSQMRRPAADWATADSQDTLRAFANATGGKAFYDNNDIAKGFREAAKDSASYYLISFYLDQTNKKPGWHKLQVKVDRGGISLRTRSGFFVTAAPVDPNVVRQADVLTAMASPLDYTQVPVRLSWKSFEAGSGPGKRKVNYEVVLPANAASVDEADDNHLKLEFVALVRLPDGKVATQPEGKVLETHLKPETLQQVKSVGVRYRNSLELPAGEYTVRFVVRDFVSGRIGSVLANLKVQEEAAGK